ncbi:MAG: hypothetical protein KF799_03775 [Bdellovibrionales bacterium]|nr:hypothetical protein [Bdellovibrionales bacterium]
MSYNHFYKNLDGLARKTFAGLSELPEVAWDHLISPLELRLPKSVYNHAQAAIEALFRVSRQPAYQSLLEDEAGMAGLPIRNDSVLMAYDFHTNEAGECFLVEINTNASGFMLSSLMEMVHKQIPLDRYQPLQDLRASFENELRLSGLSSPPQVAITDDDIVGQKMYLEFLMYRDWFRGLGWQAEFCDGKDFVLDGGQLKTAGGMPVNLVYNRLTDFYLEESQHQALREAYALGGVSVSPNPKEYWRLADKQRLVQLTEPGFLEKAGASEQDKEAILRILIPTFEKSAFGSVDEIWAQRRGLFFKPKRSYGGKSVYRGESVSRKVFERLMADDILIQRFQPAQKVPTDDERSVLNNWKFDVRFYVYQDRIQLVCARIYQGQVTNFSSPMGGFTSVQF